MIMTKYRITIEPYDGNSFFYVCGSLEELYFVYKFLKEYHLFTDQYEYTDITVQRERTQEEQERAYLFKDDPDYWVPYTDEFVELTKAKTVVV